MGVEAKSSAGWVKCVRFKDRLNYYCIAAPRGKIQLDLAFPA